MGINTSEITSAASDGDISLNPNGTGKVQLTKLAGNGELPVGVAGADGEIKAFDHRDLTPLDSVDVNDLLLVQRGVDYFTVDASTLGGGVLGDPFPVNVSWLPYTPPGSGTLDDPWRLAEITVATPGGAGTSVETMVISGMKPDITIPIYDKSVAPSLGRFEQRWLTCDNEGGVQTQFFYRDVPNSTDPATYNGVIKIGTTTVWVTWDVTQRTNKTVFQPASAPTASPTTVDYPADGKYGTVFGFWADGSQTLAVTNMVFSVNDGPLNGFNKLVVDGDKVIVGFVDATVAAAAEGDTITGTLTSADDSYLNEFVMVKDVTPTAFTLPSQVDKALSTETTVSFGNVKGVNAPTTIAVAGSGGNPLTSTKVSINGGTPTSIVGTTFNPGDTIEGYGTTGSANDTTYQATFTLGGVDGGWDVTTTSTNATIAQPSITSPLNGAFNLVPDVTVVGSDYDALNGAGAHSSSDWEVYETDLGVLSTGVITAFNEYEVPDIVWESVTDSSLNTISNGGKTLSWNRPSGGSLSQASGTVASGKMYVEFNISGTAYDNTGEVGWGSESSTDASLLANFQQFYAPGATTVFNPAGIDSTNFVLMAAIDVDNNKIWYGVDGNWHNGENPADGVNTYWSGTLPSDVRLRFTQSYFGTQTFTISTNPLYAPSGFMTEYEITLADSTNLNQFVAGVDVAQDSGGAPETSAITTANTQSGAWTAASSTDNVTNWQAVAYGNGMWVAVSRTNGTERAMYSTDGITWNQPSGVDNTKDFTAVAYGNGMFVATGINSAMYSSDGINWTASTPFTGQWFGITYGNGKFVAVSNTGSNRVMYSTDGINWTSVTTTTAATDSQSWYTVTYGGGKFVATANAVATGSLQSVMYSTDGTNWTLASAPVVANWQAVAYGNGMFVAVAWSGTERAMYSTDGINWTLGSNADAGSQWYGVAYGNGTFTAVAFNGTDRVMYSSDGINWTSATAAEANGWFGVAYGDDKFVAVAANGTNRVMWSYTGTGEDQTILTLTNDTNLANFRVGDAVTETGGDGTGTISAIGATDLTLSPTSGTWDNGSTVTGPTFTAATGTVGSVDTSANTITLSASDQTGTKRWLVTEAGYETAKKLNKKVANPLIPATPGAPTTEPPSSEYTSVTPSAETLTTATLDDTNLNENKVYYSRVKYSDGSISSEFSAYSEFVTKASFVPDIGDAYGGGYFAGQIDDSGTIYNLIVAPITSGGLEGINGGSSPNSILYKTADTASTNAQSLVYGATAMLANNTTTHPMFNWCASGATGPNAGVYDGTNATGTGIGGFNDWYIPARHELAILYFFLKPDGTVNDVNSGDIPTSVAPYTPNTTYGPGFPSITSNSLFVAGGGQDFNLSLRYWSATEDQPGGKGAGFAGVQNLDSGYWDYEEKSKPGSFFARAIRRVAA